MQMDCLAYFSPMQAIGVSTSRQKMSKSRYLAPEQKRSYPKEKLEPTGASKLCLEVSAYM
jgi:hypothetical protein